MSCFSPNLATPILHIWLQYNESDDLHGCLWCRSIVLSMIKSLMRPSFLSSANTSPQNASSKFFAIGAVPLMNMPFPQKHPSVAMMWKARIFGRECVQECPGRCLWLLQSHSLAHRFWMWIGIKYSIPPAASFSARYSLRLKERASSCPIHLR